MNGASSRNDQARLVWATLALTAAATVALLIFCILYVRYAGGFLAQLDVSVGEMLMEEGRRFEEAGAYENAKERYLLALDSRFEGPQNRAYILKSLGMRLWVEGEHEKAVAYLEEAAESPYAPVSVYAPLCDALLKLERYDDATALLARWEAAADTTGIAAYQAEAKFYAGQLAMVQGDTQAAESYYREGDAVEPGGRNAAELAHLYYAAGEYSKALEFAERYLRNGGVGSRADYARQIRTEALKKLESQRADGAASSQVPAAEGTAPANGS